MAINTQVMSNSYVKFVRTTVAKWDLLTNKDADTLYFVISDDNSKGSLYLGSALIANNLSAGLSLSQLTDFVASGTFTNEDVVVYQGGRWTNKQISSFMPVTMKGATSDESGEGGLVPVPKAGDNTLYLRGDGTWANPTVGVVSDLETLTTKVNTLDSNLTKVIGTDINKSMRSVASEVAATEVAKIVDNAPEAFDTLKEIAAWIQGSDSSATDAADMLADITALNNAVFGTEEKDGLVTEVATLKQGLTDLTGTVSGLNTKLIQLSDVVGNETMGLVKKVNTMETTVGNHTTQINELSQKLMWSTLVEE